MIHLRFEIFTFMVLLSVKDSLGVGPMIDPDHLILESDCGSNSILNDFLGIYPWAIKVKRNIKTLRPNVQLCAGSVITKR